MKKALKKRERRGQKNLQLYAPCNLNCGGCGSGNGGNDYVNVQDAHYQYTKSN